MSDDLQIYLDEIDKEASALLNESGEEEDNSFQSQPQKQTRVKKSAKSTKSKGREAELDKENEPQNQSKRRPKPKVTAVWMKDDIRELIHAVELQPSIWDFEDEDHKNLTKRAAAWCAIVEDLKNRFNETECKAKWINIKNAYSNAKSKMLHTKSGQATETQPTWTYWHDMSFLTKKEALTNTVSVSTLDFAAIDTTGDSEMSATPSQRPLSCPPAASGSGIANRRRKLSSTSESSTTQSSKLIEQAMKTLDSLPPDDEWQIMGNYLASHARSIASKDRVAADHLHRKLIKTVLDYLDDLEASQQPQTMGWQPVHDLSMPTGTMQLVPLSIPSSIQSMPIVFTAQETPGSPLLASPKDLISTLETTPK